MVYKKKNSGASKGYKRVSEMITGWGKKPRKAKVKAVKKGKKPSYKVPKTPKVSGRGWR